MRDKSRWMDRTVRVVPLDERQRAVLLLLVLTLVFSVIGAFSWLSTQRAAGDVDNGACNGAFNGNPEGTLQKQTVPPGGTEQNPPIIAPGTTVQVTITWHTGDWSSLNQLFDCVRIGGVQNDALSYQEKPPANDGVAVHSYTIPLGTPHGTIVCDRARLSGTPAPGNVQTQKSNQLCFRVDPLATTTTTIHGVPDASTTTTIHGVPDASTTTTIHGVPGASTTTTIHGVPGESTTTTIHTVPDVTTTTTIVVAEEPTTTTTIVAGRATTTTTRPPDGATTTTTTRPPGGATTTTSTPPGGGTGSQPPTQVGGQVDTRAPLARTGNETIALLAMALAILNLGATLVVAGSTRSHGTS